MADVAVDAVVPQLAMRIPKTASPMISAPILTMQAEGQGALALASFNCAKTYLTLFQWSKLRRSLWWCGGRLSPWYCRWMFADESILGSLEANLDSCLYIELYYFLRTLPDSYCICRCHQPATQWLGKLWTFASRAWYSCFNKWSESRYTSTLAGGGHLGCSEATERLREVNRLPNSRLVYSVCVKGHCGLL